MKTFIILFSILIYTSLLCSQTRRLSFEPKTFALTNKHKKQLLKYYNKLNPKEELRLVLYSKKEFNKTVKTQKYLLKITKKRAKETALFILNNTEAEEENIAIAYTEHRITKSNEFSSKTHSPIDLIITKTVKKELFYTFQPKLSNNLYTDFINLCDKNIKVKTIVNEKLNIKITIPASGLAIDECKGCKLKVVYGFYDKKSQFIEQNLTATSNGSILVSAGMFYVKVFCKNKEVKLKKGSKILLNWNSDIEINKFAKQPGFNGDVSNVEFIYDHFEGTENDIVNWTNQNYFDNDNIKDNSFHYSENPIEKEDSVFFKIKIFSEIGFKYIEKIFTYSKEEWELQKRLLEEQKILDSVTNYTNSMVSFNLGYINCDAFYNLGNKITKLTVNTDMDKKPSVRMIFKDMNSVLPGKYYAGDTAVFFDKIPLGKSVDVLSFVVSKNNKKVKWNAKSITLGEKEEIELKLINTSSLKEFKEMLKKYD